ncbi:MAG: hypothetical protein GKR93_14585 [Gammaproteobacteria bacterium]|nr:hypothetical protein [Gammaproteobacteria bacterium]
MKSLITIVFLIATVLILFFKPTWLPFFSNGSAFDSEGNPEVWLFSFPRCGNPCRYGRKELAERNVDYSEIDIEKSKDNYKLWKSFNRDQFPLIVIGKHIVEGYQQANIAAALAQTYGEIHLKRSEQYYMARHFHDDGSPRIVMYGTDWCPYCKKLRDKFSDNNVIFAEINVEKPVVKKELMGTLSISSYPITYVGYKRFEGSEVYGDIVSAAGY